MKIIQKRVGPNQNIAFLSMIVALIGCLSILGSFVPLSAIFIILLIPAISSLTLELIEDKYTVAFVLSSIVITFICSAYDLSCALFYAVPAILSGTVYGLLNKKRCSDLISIFVASIVQLGCNYLSMPIINLIYDVDIVYSTLSLISLQNSPIAYDFLPAFLFFYSLAEMILSYVVLYLCKQHLDNKNTEILKHSSFIAPFAAILCSFISCLFIPFYLNVTYLFLLFSLYFSLYCFYLTIINKDRKIIYLTLVMISIGIFLFIFLYPMCPQNAGLSLLNFIALAVSIPAIITVSN